MISPLKIGIVLVQGNPVIPDSVCVQRGPFCSDWQAITNLTGDEQDRQLRNDGWNFILSLARLEVLPGDPGAVLQFAAQQFAS